jgi:hypothetical protein
VLVDLVTAVTIIKHLKTSLAVSGLVVVMTAAASRSALAQVELAGSWAARNHEDALERGGGPYAVDYTGIPINDEARQRALSYSASQLSMIERQCSLWAQYYLVTGPFGMKISNETDPIDGSTIAWKIGGWEDRAPMMIWMDGRPHPSKYAIHERGGFTTGVWDGSTLVATTTHMKASSIRRNGTPTSDEATMVTSFIRHGDVLTVLVVVEDPIYLTEPVMYSKGFELDTSPQMPIGPPCVAGYEGVDDRQVPHFLPGANPSINEITELYHIPREAVMGGAETMYPEYRKKIKEGFVRPEKCLRNCGGPPPQR